MKNIEKNWLEWIVFMVGLVLVVSVLGYLVYASSTLGDAPPSVELKLGKPQPQSKHFLIPVSVTNRGDETAEGVQIEVTLEQGGKEIENGAFEIAFLPRHSTRSGWVSFETDPRTAQIQARVLGFENP